MKNFLLAMGTLSALLISSQLVMGLLIIGHPESPWVKRHQHSGYLTVVVALVYILFSLMTIASMPKTNKN